MVRRWGRRSVELAAAMVISACALRAPGVTASDPASPQQRIVQSEFTSINKCPGLPVFRARDQRSGIVPVAHCINDHGISSNGLKEFTDSIGRQFQIILTVDNLNAVSEQHVFLGIK